MPLNPSLLSVKQATAALVRQRTHADGLLRYTERQRHDRLQRFLAQQRAVGQWARSCSALVDAVQHGVRISADDIHTTMQTCGAAGARTTVRQLFYRGFKTWRIAKSAASELAFVDSCAASGDFNGANQRLAFLLQRVAHPTEEDRSASCVNTDLVVAYLGCAVRASEVAPSGSTSSSNGRAGAGVSEREVAQQDAWSAAISTFVSIRRNPNTQSLVSLTPQVLQRLSQLAEHGGQWRAAVQIITGASARHLLVPPESYDAAIRCCYAAKQHPLVVALVRRCIASKSAPDEASVRMALRSTEEVVAAEGLVPLMEDLPMMATFTANPSALSPSSLGDGGLGVSVRAPDTWALALKLYEGLRDNGLALLPQTFEGPLRTCCASGKWDVAANLLREMKQFERRVPVHAYRSVALSKLEHCTTYDAARAFLDAFSILDRRNPMTYAALLRCCIRNGDWANFKRTSTEMKRLELPETYETIKLLMVAAFAQKNPHGVVTRYVRWLQLTQYEMERVTKDDVVPLHASDFSMEPPLCRLVLSACEHLIQASKRSTTFRLDPIVWVAHKDVLKRLSGGRDLLEGRQAGASTSNRGASDSDATVQPWLFANTAGVLSE